MRSRFAPVILLGALALTATACSAPGSTDDAEVSQELILGSNVPPATFEASSTRWPNDAPFLQAVYDSLVKVTTDGTDVEPNLAEEWAYNEDNTVLEMTLRDDVTFTGGTAFTAEVAAENLLRYKNGTGTAASLLGSVTDVLATDSDTLVITLDEPDPGLLVTLGQAPGMMQSAETFDAADAATNPVGSGPYELDAGKTVVGSSYVFTKNPEYWNPDTVHYDTITVEVLTDASAMLNALRGDQLDAAIISDSSTIDQITSAGYTAYELQPDFTGLMLFDRAGAIAPELADVRVRQAINYAVDREAMLQAVNKGYGTITEQVFHPVSEGYSEDLDSAYDYDPEKAKELLADAGYADGFTLTVPTSAGQGSVVWPLVQQQLSGVGITTQFVDVGQNLISDLIAAKYAVAYLSIQRNPVDWVNINTLLSPEALWNPFRCEDPKVDELIDTVQDAPADDQAAAVAELNEYIVDQAWFSPWYSRINFFVANEDTDVTTTVSKPYPNIWDITPAQ